jgi:thymidylate synthase
MNQAIQELQQHLLNPQEQTYLNLMHNVHTNGQIKTDRTGTGTRSDFGKMMRFNLQDGIPMLTTKKIHLKSIIHEIIWFLAGSTNIQYLKDNGVTIWDEWADENGELGPVYGKQWRRWEDTKVVPVNRMDEIDELVAQGYTQLGHITKLDFTLCSVLQKEYDQITDAMNAIKNNPDSRRIIVNAWNVGDVPGMKLPPCHAMYQFYVSDMTSQERANYAIRKGVEISQDMVSHYASVDEYLDHVHIPRKKLSCMLYQRSADIFLGVPFNIVSYSMLVHMFAQQADMAVGDFIWVGGDCHIYSNHTEQVDLQLSRDARAMPQLVLKRKPKSIFDYKFEDFEITGYDPHPTIKAPVAV